MERYEVCILGCLLGCQIGEGYHLLVAVDLLERFVLLHDTYVIFVFKPVGAALLQLSVELGIELIVVDKTGIVDLIGIDTDETA